MLRIVVKRKIKAIQKSSNKEQSTMKLLSSFARICFFYFFPLKVSVKYIFVFF